MKTFFLLPFSLVTQLLNSFCFLICSVVLCLSIHPAFLNFFLLPQYFNSLLLKCCPCSCLVLLAFKFLPSFTLLFFSLKEVFLSVWEGSIKFFLWMIIVLVIFYYQNRNREGRLVMTPQSLSNVTICRA